MGQHQKSYLLNAFLLGVITGFFIAPLKNGIQVHVISRGSTDDKTKYYLLDLKTLVIYILYPI